jgi:NAD(P)-dependent dehydrogenase (short-subunit alcohol dehydrogenase family)
MEEVSPEEIMQVTIINQLVPTLIVNQLRPFMSKPTFIIVCTALEGTFDYTKNDKHPHTNMCKAALNMMIRTMHEEKDPHLHVYSINPGFVSGVNPNPSVIKYPLTPEDGASRILDPIIQYYNKTPLPKN